MNQGKLSLIPVIFPVLVNVATVSATFNPITTADSSSLGEFWPGSGIEIAQYVPPKGLRIPPTVGGGTRYDEPLRGDFEAPGGNLEPASLPAVRGVAGTHGGRCSGDNDSERTPSMLTLLMPNLPSELTNFGATVSESPEFLVYIPQTVARQAEFVLKDEENNNIYRTIFEISGEEAIARLTLPSDNIKLETGMNYSWYFSLICNPQNLRNNVVTQGWTQRIQLNPNLMVTLETADPITRSQLYAENGIWHEAIAILAQLRQEQPTDPILAQTWQTLLESANLLEIVTLPNEVPIIAIRLKNTSAELEGTP